MTYFRAKKKKNSATGGGIQTNEMYVYLERTEKNA